MVSVNYIYNMVVDTQFHKFYGRPFARVVYLSLMKDIGRWLPWVLPGSTGRFYKDDVVHNHSAHGYYITRMEGGVRYTWYYCCYMLNRTKQNSAKTAIHITQELVLVTFHIEDHLSDEASKIDVRTWCKTQKLQVRGTPCKCCCRSQQRSSPGLRLRLTPLLVLIERVWWWISHFLITSSAVDIYDKAHFTRLW